MAVSAPPAPATRRRRWPRILLGSLIAVIVLLAAALAAVVWYVSGQIGSAAAVPQPDAGFPMTITAIDGSRVSYSGVPSGWTDQGLAAIATSEGAYAQTSDPVVTSDGAGTRTIDADVGDVPLAVGQHARLDGWYFGSDPATVLGLPFTEVDVATPGGPAPAWLIPGEKSTWVVYAHGRGDAPAQGLRMARTVAQQGYPMLLVTYRNDPGAPAGTGYAQFGADEWRDLEAGVQYALDNGAESVVLAGTSMGGGMALAFLEHSDLADSVRGAFLDAPASDYGRMVSASVSDAGIPGFVTPLAKQVAAWRFGMDWSGMDHVADAGRLSAPVVLVQGEQDGTVGPDVNSELAQAAPAGVVTYVAFPDAAHTTAWNMDAPRYEALLTDFLAEFAPS